jgi:two-component system phosphate regulon sensor histidine kinase PhoR
MSRPESDGVDTPHEGSRVRLQRNGLRRQIQRLHVLQRVSQELASELDIDRLLRNILRSAVMVLEANAGSLILLDEMTDELVFRVVEGGGGEKLRGKRMSRHQGIAGSERASTMPPNR